MAEMEMEMMSCPRATQDITLNLKNLKNAYSFLQVLLNT